MIDKFVVIRWLLSHTQVLRSLSEIVAQWTSGLSLAEKLDIIYKVAQALLPIIESFPLFQASALPITAEDEEEQLAYAQSLGIAPLILVNVLAPIVVNLIRSLLSPDDE